MLISVHFHLSIYFNNFKQSFSIMDNAIRQMEENENCQGGNCYNIYNAPEIEAIASNIDRYFCGLLSQDCQKSGLLT